MKYDTKFELGDEIYYTSGRYIQITKICKITQSHRDGLHLEYEAGINADIKTFKESELFKTKQEAKEFLIKAVEAL